LYIRAFFPIGAGKKEPCSCP